jgi:hypothetical protein
MDSRASPEASNSASEKSNEGFRELCQNMKSFHSRRKGPRKSLSRHTSGSRPLWLAAACTR